MELLRPIALAAAGLLALAAVYVAARLATRAYFKSRTEYEKEKKA